MINWISAFLIKNRQNMKKRQWLWTTSLYSNGINSMRLVVYMVLNLRNLPFRIFVISPQKYLYPSPYSAESTLSG